MRTPVGARCTSQAREKRPRWGFARVAWGWRLQVAVLAEIALEKILATLAQRQPRHCGDRLYTNGVQQNSSTSCQLSGAGARMRSATDAR